MLIKSFKLFESIDRKTIELFCADHNIDRYTINSDGSIDVDDNVDIIGEMKTLPLKFGKVSGYFECYDLGLISLEGSPKIVGGHFKCSYNQLESLRGGPESVGGYFWCRNNELTSLEGSPKYVEGIFGCEYNYLYSFKGISENVSGKIQCDGNPVYNIYGLNPCKEFVELLNEYDVIRDHNIIETRLKQALEDSNCKRIPKRFIFENYIVI